MLNQDFFSDIIGLDQIFGQVYRMKIGPEYSMKISGWIRIAKISDLFNTIGYVEISVFGRIRCVGLEYDRILRGGSKIPHRWFIDPTQVGPISQKKSFFHMKFSATS